jgi:hypothetical protein
MTEMTASEHAQSTSGDSLAALAVAVEAVNDGELQTNGMK